MFDILGYITLLHRTQGPTVGQDLFSFPVRYYFILSLASWCHSSVSHYLRNHDRIYLIHTRINTELASMIINMFSNVEFINEMCLCVDVWYWQGRVQTNSDLSWHWLRPCHYCKSSWMITIIWYDIWSMMILWNVSRYIYVKLSTSSLQMYLFYWIYILSRNKINQFILLYMLFIFIQKRDKSKLIAFRKIMVCFIFKKDMW